MDFGFDFGGFDFGSLFSGGGTPDPAAFNPTTGVINTGPVSAPATPAFSGGSAAAVPSFGGGMPVFSGGGGAPSFGPTQIGTGGDPLAGTSLAPAGMDPIAAANFQAQNFSNPAGMAIAQNAIQTPGVNVPAVAGAPGAAPASSGMFGSGVQLSDLAKLALPAGILGFEALNQPKLPNPTATTNTLNTQAGDLAAQGKALTDPLTSGNLPAGAQASVDQAVKSAQATIRSRFAAQGLSGSPMEAESLSQAEMAGPQLAFQIAQQMASTGISELGLSSQIYTAILNSVLQSDQQLQSAIAQFAGAAAGGGPTIRLAA